MKNNLFWGINTSSCGHVMHEACWKKHVETYRSPENRRNIRMMAFNVKRKEYLCPLCDTIGNTVLPIFPDLRFLSKANIETSPEAADNMSHLDSHRKHNTLSYEDWLECLEKTLENSVKKELQDDKGNFKFKVFISCLLIFSRKNKK
jgi:E3 ubiquitin-protein ligase UBR2